MSDSMGGAKPSMLVQTHHAANIRGHYELYKERCAELGLKESHHAIPRDIVRAKLEEKKQKKDGQQKLDGIARKASQLVEFSREGVLKAVAEFIVCDNQVGVVIILIVCVTRCLNILQSLLVANKATFRNCPVAMRPKSTTADLPSTHDISTYIHNAFVKFLDELKGQIQVSNTNCCSVNHTSKYTT
jgi:hypothetical protein